MWDALISPKMTAQYWQHQNVADWQPGSRREHRRCDKDRTLDMPEPAKNAEKQKACKP